MYPWIIQTLAIQFVFPLPYPLPVFDPQELKVKTEQIWSKVNDPIIFDKIISLRKGYMQRLEVELTKYTSGTAGSTDPIVGVLKEIDTLFPTEKIDIVADAREVLEKLKITINCLKAKLEIVKYDSLQNQPVVTDLINTNAMLTGKSSWSNLWTPVPKKGQKSSPSTDFVKQFKWLEKKAEEIIKAKMKLGFTARGVHIMESIPEESALTAEQLHSSLNNLGEKVLGTFTQNDVFSKKLSKQFQSALAKKDRALLLSAAAASLITAGGIGLYAKLSTAHPMVDNTRKFQQPIVAFD